MSSISADTACGPHQLASESLGSKICRKLDHQFDTVFGAAANPWRHLGALGFLFLWIVVVSGIYVYIMFDTSVAGAYESIESLSREQPLFGGLLRSLHRYASDAFLIVTLLHLAREFLLGRYRGFRAFSWLTGVPLLWLTYAAGIGGFWLVWDQLGQFSANATAELLDAIPLFATPLTRNFLTASAVSDRMFSLFVFVHIGVPLLLLFGLWFHIQRISQADVFPARALSAGTLAALLVLSLVLPVTGQGTADMAQLPAALSFDWWYLAVHPLMYATSATTVWVLVFAITALLLALPVLPSMRRKPAQVAEPVAEVAIVSPDNCSGCRRCLDDCPYAAISMIPHPNKKIGRELAVVNADFCAACGICAGSCPSSSPFRHNETLVTGIDMPQLPVDSIRRWLDEVLADETKHGEKIIVIGCDHAVDVSAIATTEIIPLSLICTGMLPPAFVEYAIRRGAAGVLLTGCRSGGCAFRQGNQWTEDRIAGRREPHLRSNVDPSRVNIVWADRGDEAKLQIAISQFKYSLLEVSHEPSH
ncbi:MAG: hydrogenase iron-sulfur subunit [Rhodocyclaceae bacterium]|nr:hydrogenase iron-sulfur subunit [Rhodocyclaceae bacterium]MBP6108695.1 hydrogenase iron-sulfur subunit [Rhodocyclaceae bacterium]